MAPKRRLANPPKKKSKKAKRSPLELASAYGCQCETIQQVVDWKSLQQSFDALTEGQLWAMGLTYRKVEQSLSFKVSITTSTEPTKVSMASVLGLALPAAGAPTPQPNQQPHFFVTSRIKLKESDGKGRGFFAEEALEAGELLLVERPLLGVLDREWRDEAWGGCDSADTTALGIQLANAYSPSVGEMLAKHHPADQGSVPIDSSDEDAEVDEEDEEESLKLANDLAWAMVDNVPIMEKLRLQAVVKLNSLGFYTNSEQLCHGNNFTPLTGSGLFALASGFNHSCDPSVARFSIGHITAFVTNRPIAAGEELFISYIEAELLSAPVTLRTQSLNRDFTCSCTKCKEERGSAETGTQQEGHRYLNVDARVQAELAVLAPEDRLVSTGRVLQRTVDDDEEEYDEEEGEEEEGAEPGSKPSGPIVLLGKDAQELRVVQALALMQLSRFSEAIGAWRQIAAFAATHCPPFDEALPVCAVQATLCALSMKLGLEAASTAGANESSSSSTAPAPEMGEYETSFGKVPAVMKAKSAPAAAAEEYANLALSGHRVTSGCPGDLFRWRFRQEVESAEVPTAAKEAFWSLIAATSQEAKLAWVDYLSIWNFDKNEVPEAFTGSSRSADCKDDSASPPAPVADSSST